ncbi:MAG: threonine synthase [Ferruginibacter sp.]|nr:threonine synthase [Ferruginibacter sp.]
MKYYSLNKQSPVADFATATILGQAPDKGLYFPEIIPQVSKELIDNIENYSNEAIAFEVIKPYIGDAIPKDVLEKIVAETVSFEIPLVKITDAIFSLELFHGPTLAFKDVGARFMSRCLGYFATQSQTKEKITVLVATSGDTGGAVANGFYDVEGVEVVILYPSGKVSSVQEKQLTTLGKNIHALEVDGTFDECQQMVKAAFADVELNQKIKLTSANSINVARWLPQQFYYFYLYKQWKDKTNPPVVTVPSGNFGNICAGLLAQQSCLPIKHFIAACNVNDTVPDFLRTGNYQPKKAVPTISNAMDVGDPSNFIRIMQMFYHQKNSLDKTLTGFTITDNETKETLVSVLKKHNYLLDPHGAVAYNALQQYHAQHPNAKGVILETAHPVKFYDVIEPLTNQKVPVPASVEEQIKKEKMSVKISADTNLLKEFLLR